MRTALLIASLAVLAMPAAAQPPEGLTLTITPQQARTLPVKEVADIVFRQLASQMETMTRPMPPFLGGDDQALTRLTFATTPRSAGDPGLCVATLLHAGAEPPSTPGGFERPGIVATELAYKVVGDVDRFESWSLDDEAAQDRLCAQAGPAVSREEDDKGRAFFFKFSGAPRPIFGVIALQRAIRGARAGNYADVVCEDPGANDEERSGCTDAKALLGALDLANLTWLTVSQPGDGEHHYRIEGNFAVSPEAFWVVAIDTEIRPIPMRSPEYRLGRTTISQGRIFDVEEEPIG